MQIWRLRLIVRLKPIVDLAAAPRERGESYSPEKEERRESGLNHDGMNGTRDRIKCGRTNITLRGSHFLVNRKRGGRPTRP